MKNFNQLMKQAQELQGKIAEMQEQLERLTVEGSSGGGMVYVTINGKTEMRRVKIDPSLIDVKEIEVLEDLIVAAFNDAKGKMEAKINEETAKITGGLKLPGGTPFSF